MSWKSSTFISDSVLDSSYIKNGNSSCNRFVGAKCGLLAQDTLYNGNAWTAVLNRSTPPVGPLYKVILWQLSEL
jgi:geranylgeranyl pyrophosphate synthase